MTWAPTRAARHGQVAHGEAVVTQRAVGVGLAAVDVGPGAAVDDGVGQHRPDQLLDGVAVAAVEAGVVDAHDVVVRLGAQELDDLGADLAPGPGDEDPARRRHQPVRPGTPAQAVDSATGARPFSGSHQARWSPRTRPRCRAGRRRTPTVGAQPSSRRSFDESRR